MIPEFDLPRVLQPWSARLGTVRAEAWPSGGFSGAMIWKLHSSQGNWCLRRWPQEHPSRERLDFIHRVLAYVGNRGFKLAPVPLATETGSTFVPHGGRLWEVTAWMPGAADYPAFPTSAKLRAALTALAEFHRATESFPRIDVRPAVSAGIEERWEKLFRYVRAPDLASHVNVSRLWPELVPVGSRLCTLFVRGVGKVSVLLQRALEAQVAIQPCIRDVWHDHVLFSGDEVTGMIDYGSMRLDNVSTDIARLLGSLAGDDREAWDIGLQAYQQVRQLTQDEQLLVRAFDQSSVLMSGLQWLWWIGVEGRQFDDRPKVLARIEEILARAEHAFGRS